MSNTSVESDGETMAEPTSMGVLGKLLAGSAVGSLASLVAMPAKNHKDAAARGAVSMAVTMCSVPLLSRMAVAYWTLPTEWVPDVTLGIAVAVGLVAWTAVSCWVRYAESRSEAVQSEGLAGVVKGRSKGKTQ